MDSPRVQLFCAACIAFGSPDGEEQAQEAFTIYNGNALCADHIEIGFSIQPLLQHRQTG